MFNNLTCSTENIKRVFFGELNKRIRLLEIKSSSGCDCICVDMQNCSEGFAKGTEEFFKKNDKHFKIHVKGKLYYIEVLNMHTLGEAFIPFENPLSRTLY